MLQTLWYIPREMLRGAVTLLITIHSYMSQDYGETVDQMGRNSSGTTFLQKTVQEYSICMEGCTACAH